MITNSYSASCYIENNDGEYHIKCVMGTDKGDFHSQYDGRDFVNGVNTIVSDLQKQIKEKNNVEKEMTLEEQVNYFKKVIDDLQNENTNLKNQIKLNKSKKEEIPYTNIKINSIADILDDYLNEIYYKNEKK